MPKHTVTREVITFRLLKPLMNFRRPHITLHKVADGNYDTDRVSEAEFNAYPIELENGTETGISLTSNISRDSINPDQKNWFHSSDQDNENLIKSIGKYIDTFYDVTPKYIFDENDKLILTYDLRSGDSPTIKVYVEALAPNERTFGEVARLTERRIKVSSYIDVSEYIKDTAKRLEILELNNTWLNKLWEPHSISLTAAGNIALNSSINIPGKDFPVPIECIRGLLSGTLTGWEEYSVELLKVLNKQEE